jgi:hypothetical protein
MDRAGSQLRRPRELLFDRSITARILRYIDRAADELDVE